MMKRQRGRGRRSTSGNRSFESNGPDVKIRGSATQIHEKYVQYARDAQTAGDRVKAENYLQHAEHYYRISPPRNNDGEDKTLGETRNRQPDAPCPPAAENGVEPENPMSNQPASNPMRTGAAYRHRDGDRPRRVRENRSALDALAAKQAAPPEE